MRLKFSKRHPTPPKKLWNWLEATLIGLLALVGMDLVLGGLLGVSLGVLRHLPIGIESLIERIQGNSVTANFVFFLVSRLMGFGLIFYFIRSRGINLRRFGFKRFAPFKSAGMIVVAMLGLLITSGLVFYLTQRLIPNLNLQQEQDIIFTQASQLPELVMAFVALVIVAPLVEESIFRGLMLPAYARKFGIVPAAIVTSVLFGAVHWQINVGIITFIMGLFLAWLYYKTRSLWPAIIFHSLKNLLAFVLIFNLPR